MPYTETCVNTDTGEFQIREPYKVIRWVLTKAEQGRRRDEA